MTLLVFPELDGIEYGETRRAEFKTGVFEAQSGREARSGFRQYPKWFFKLPVISLVRDQDEDQLRLLLGFMLKQRGMLNAFLYKDKTDCDVTDYAFATGDGSKTAFQLTRDMGGVVEPTQNLNGDPVIAVDDVEQVKGSDYTLSSTGLVTFATAPSDGSVITWTGGFYYRVRFLADGYDLAQMMRDLAECNDIEFTGSVRNLV